MWLTCWRKLKCLWTDLFQTSLWLAYHFHKTQQFGTVFNYLYLYSRSQWLEEANIFVILIKCAREMTAKKSCNNRSNKCLKLAVFLHLLGAVSFSSIILHSVFPEAQISRGQLEWDAVLLPVSMPFSLQLSEAKATGAFASALRLVPFPKCRTY